MSAVRLGAMSRVPGYDSRSHTVEGLVVDIFESGDHRRSPETSHADADETLGFEQSDLENGEAIEWSLVG